MITDLTPSPEMKDSGAEWLGEVPVHWEVRKIKQLICLKNGLPFKPSDWASKGVPIIRIQNLNGSNDFNYTTREDLPDALLIKPGELLFAWSGNRGTSFGSFVWNRDFSGHLNQDIFKLVLPCYVYFRQLASRVACRVCRHNRDSIQVFAPEPEPHTT